jgi:hypothetical protein
MKVMNAYESDKYLAKKGFPMSRSQLVKKFEDISIKAPLVLKIVSPDAIHKTEIGGVKIVYCQSNVKLAFDELIEIVKKKKLRLDGIMVQEYNEGIQLIAGLKNDLTFGTVILFGLGGIYTEVFKDTTIRVCPIDEQEAGKMIQSLKSKEIFNSFRGKRLAVGKLKDILVKLSKLKDIDELDLNPIIINEKEALIVDARIVLS